MAYLQARSGIARSGVTYAGWTKPAITITISGTTRTTNVRYEACTIRTTADGTAPVFTFLVKGLTPALGADVKVLYTTPDDYLFAGTLLQAEPVTPISPIAANVQWACTAVGYQWLMDRYDLVTKQYPSTGVNHIVADILASFTNGGFRVGYVPSGLGNLNMDFTLETVSGATNRIARAKGAFWELSHDKVLSMYTSALPYPEAALPTLGNSSQVRELSYRSDLTQVRTRAIIRGRGSSTTGVVGAGASTIELEDISPFDVAGGQAIVTQNIITYTGTSTASGVGSLTGVTGLVYEVPQGSEVNILNITVGSAETTALATLLGGGLSGQATHAVSNNRISAAECAARGQAELDVFGAAITDFEYVTMSDRYTRVGRQVTASITSPLTISGTFRIQAVVIHPYGPISGTTATLSKQVSASKFSRSLTTLLKEIEA